MSEDPKDPRVYYPDGVEVDDEDDLTTDAILAMLKRTAPEVPNSEAPSKK